MTGPASRRKVAVVIDTLVDAVEAGVGNVVVVIGRITPTAVNELTYKNVNISRFISKDEVICFSLSGP